MKRTTMVLALAAALAIPVSAGAAGQSLKFCTDPAFPPMESATTSGSMVGFDIDMAKARLGFSRQSYPRDTDAVAQLLLGRADAVLTQDTSAAYQIGKHPGKLAIAYLFPQQDSFGIYYRKGDAIGPQLKTAVAKLRSD